MVISPVVLLLGLKRKMTHVTWRPDNRKQIPAKSAHASVGHYHAQQAAPCHLATSESSQPLCSSPTWLQLPPNPSDRAAWPTLGTNWALIYLLSCSRDSGSRFPNVCVPQFFTELMYSSLGRGNLFQPYLQTLRKSKLRWICRIQVQSVVRGLQQKFPRVLSVENRSWIQGPSRASDIPH